MKKLSLAIFMSGQGTNAEKIIEYNSNFFDVKLIFSDNPCSNYRKISKKNNISYELNNIYDFFEIDHMNISKKDRKKLKDIKKRKEYDKKTKEIIKKYNIDIIATAGYNWVITEGLCNSYIIINVHPGDLTIKNKEGIPLYSGLGWIPTAKAILNNELSVRTSTHIITEKLDSGTVLRISEPVYLNIPINYKEIINNRNIKLKDIKKYYKNSEIEKFIYLYSVKIQKELKLKGDWIEFPLTLDLISKYLLENKLIKTENGSLYFNNKIVKDLFLMEK